MTKLIRFFLIVFSFSFIFSNVYAADLNVNILAVNGTDKEREKDVNFTLPKELTVDDILDTAGLELDYDINKGSYFVYGKITLGPKETKTFKVRIRDLWKVDKTQIEAIKGQISSSSERLKGSEFYETGQIKQDSLFKRLDYVVGQQEKFANNIERRIDSFRIYAKELDDIRRNAFSNSYWKAKPPSLDNKKVVSFIIEVENPSKEKSLIIDKKHYLPSEVKPEHLLNRQGFDLHYDLERGESYLLKEEEFKPGELKKYTIEIIDVWYIPQIDIEDLRERARKAYKLLENTKYVDSAGFLMKSIKKNLELIEVSQEKEKSVKEHISVFRTNTKRFDRAQEDVKSLEDLLAAVRENLERSKIKNVLQKIKSFKSISDIAESLFSKKNMTTTWKIIIGILVFVGLITIVHFTLWGRRSKATKVEQEDVVEESSEEKEGSEKGSEKKE